ncbi:MAG: succinate dehydrogenase/fumarate reductase iron-sulfur subunit [Bacteroidetes bacterium]|nr:succinate dehydrogenase/fumarate reductase iron-sulfur subunit [Bacteroidota bacterium]
MKLNLKVWRQKNANTTGKLVDYTVDGLNPDMSFLEMVDVLNDQLVKKGEEPVGFDHDCREGICGMCSMYIDGRAHGPQHAATTCQLYLRSFKDGDTVHVEPWRSRAFPIVNDLVTDRSAFDRIIAAGGFVSVNTGQAQDANNLPVEKLNAEKAMDAAACIGCGACVAACPNGAAMLFVSAKISQLALLPQGQPERDLRALRMVEQMDAEGFGNCSNIGACEAECPKEIKLTNIARMNRDFLVASVGSETE